VTFNKVTAKVISDRAARIEVDVPSGATTGYIRVTTPGGARKSASTFTVNYDSSSTSTTPASPSIVIGNSNSDSAVVSGDATYGSPTGTVTFYECGPTTSPETCTSTANSVGDSVSVTAGANDTSTASSVSFTPDAAGYWCFAGYYSGDSNYSSSSDATIDECFDVTTGATASATTTTPASLNIGLGEADSDNAAVSGDATYGSPTGTVTFYECGATASPEPCTSMSDPLGAPVDLTAGSNDSSTASSVSFTAKSTGYWCFAGYYSGDSNYEPSSDSNTNECFDVTGPTISNVVIGGDVESPTVTVSGSGFATIANLGSAGGSCGTGNDYGDHFVFIDETQYWSAGEGSPAFDCIGVIIQSYSNTEVVFTFGSQYGVYRIGNGVALLSSGDQFTMGLLGASLSGTAEYVTASRHLASRSSGVGL